ncbi:MAG: hypothetical protein LBG16_00140 [Elusimicrobiota bacterium]|jgi:hypothetical protein|nr:hypothetical protein [Elusimicrobiota bacterium]
MKKFLMFIILSVLSLKLFAAVGCDLNDPDRDVKRFFPDSTGYKTEYASIAKSGGQELLKKVEARLQDNFQGLYETIDVPYTIYTVYKNKEILGYIHGINQKGRYGGLQVFLTYSPQGTIVNFYYQKLTSKKSKLLRSADFAKQFAGLVLEDFLTYDPKSAEGGSQKVSAIKNPVPEDSVDFNATLRAVKKNLILTDIFVFNKKEKTNDKKEAK